MAKGDVRPTLYRGGRGGWGGSSTHYYDDEGRGASKGVWDWFKENYEINDFSKEWLMGMPDEKYHWLLKGSVVRYNLIDIAFNWAPGYSKSEDSRAHRLVLQHLTENDWLEFHAKMVAGYNAHKEFIRKKDQEAADRYRGEHAAYEAQREAERAVVEREIYETLDSAATITTGMLQSEFNQTFVSKDIIGGSGDWIEEVGDTYISGEGFGDETKKATGMKLQITVSLDLSNSMRYNGIHEQATEAFRTISWSLKQLKSEYSDDLYVSCFVFSLDEWGSAVSGYGKAARRLEYRESSSVDKYGFGDLRMVLPDRNRNIDYQSLYDGHDTHISPLLRKIEEWEKEHSDPGAVRLDIILTDAVLEHPKDIREADVIQERRNGNLQTVFMNFMPESDWINSTMPKRCFQMRVESDNIYGMLLNVISEFVAVHM